MVIYYLKKGYLKISVSKQPFKFNTINSQLLVHKSNT